MRALPTSRCGLYFLDGIVHGLWSAVNTECVIFFNANSEAPVAMCTLIVYAAVMMTLPDYIRRVGDDSAARQFGVTRRAVSAWRRCERAPAIGAAAAILAASAGKVGIEGIYMPYIRRHHPDALESVP